MSLESVPGLPSGLLLPLTEEEREALRRRHEPEYETLRAAGRAMAERIERMILGIASTEDEKRMKR